MSNQFLILSLRNVPRLPLPSKWIPFFQFHHTNTLSIKKINLANSARLIVSNKSSSYSQRNNLTETTAPTTNMIRSTMTSVVCCPQVSPIHSPRRRLTTYVNGRKEATFTMAPGISSRGQPAPERINIGYSNTIPTIWAVRAVGMILARINPIPKKLKLLKAKPAKMLQALPVNCTW